MDDVNTGHERNLKFIHNKIEFRFTVLMSVKGLESDACTNYTYNHKGEAPPTHITTCDKIL